MSLKPYPEYKESGVDWLGEVPAGWEVTDVRKLGNIRLGKMLQTSRHSGTDLAMPYLSAISIQEDGVNLEPTKTMWVGLDEAKKLSVEQGDVLVVEGGSVGRSAYINENVHGIVFQNSINRIRAYKGIADGRFIDYSLKSMVASGIMEMVCNKSTIMHLTAEKLGRLSVTLPPLSEQQVIADFLDRETNEIDMFIADQEDLIALLGERRRALITRAVTKGLTPGTQMKDSGVSWLGEVPAHWSLSKLGHHYEVVLGKMLDGAKEAPIGARVLPYIRAGNIQDSGLDLSDVNEMAYTPYEAKRLDLIAKDLLVVEGGSVGTVHYLESAMYGWSFQKTVNRVRSLGSADTKYLGNLILTFRDSGVFEVICNGSTIMHLTAEKLRALTIPVPTVNEQRSIAVFIDRETGEIDAAVEEARVAIALSKERRSAVISAAVTGKIDVREVASRISTNKVGAESVGVA